MVWVPSRAKIQVGRTALLVLAVVLLGVIPTNSSAGVILSGSPSFSYGPAITGGAGGTLTSSDGSISTLSSGFTVNNLSFSYTSVASDVGKTLTIAYSITEGLSWTTGTFQDLVSVAGTVTFGTTISTYGLNTVTQWSSTNPPTAPFGQSQAVLTNSAPLTSSSSPYAYNATSTKSFSLTGSGSTVLVQGEELIIKPTAAGQVFSFSGSVTSETYATPEPATLGTLSIAGLFGLALRRRKAALAA